jgi:hypothetical protein
MKRGFPRKNVSHRKNLHLFSLRRSFSLYTVHGFGFSLIRQQQPEPEIFKPESEMNASIISAVKNLIAVVALDSEENDGSAETLIVAKLLGVSVDEVEMLFGRGWAPVGVQAGDVKIIVA